MLLVALLLLTSPPADRLTETARAICSAKDAAAIDPMLSAEMRAHVSAAQIFEVLAGLRKEHGACEEITAPSSERVEYRFARARVPGRLYLDDHAKISGLWFGPAERLGETVDEMVAALAKLPGEVALTLTGPDDKPIARRGADHPLAVGSTFKLFILRALADDVAAGKRRWADVVELDPRHRSLPSGKLQDWPARSPITLHTLAALMISESDNTATDELLLLLGRERVEQAAGTRNRPFLTTLEAFKLTSERGQALAARFDAAKGESARRAVLKALEAIPGEDLGAWRGDGQLKTVGWFYSTDELCKVIRGLNDLELLGINTGLAAKNRWKAVRFKGGSAPGLRNFTHLLQSDRGWSCVSVTWNDPKRETKAEQFDELVGRLLSAVARAVTAPR